MRKRWMATISVVLLVGSSATVQAQEGDVSATHVTGRIVNSQTLEMPEVSELDGFMRMTMTTEREIEWSDDRLPPLMVVRSVMDLRQAERAEGPVSADVGAHAYRLEDPMGAWSGSGRSLMTSPQVESYDDWSDEYGPVMVTYVQLTGEGAYEGLFAVFAYSANWSDYLAGVAVVDGYILEGELPAEPEPIEP